MAGETVKYTLELTKEQNEQLGEFQDVLQVKSKAEVIRKALGLAALMSEITRKKQRLGIVDPANGNQVVELIRIL